jgi:hypothetical protein
MVNDKDMEEMTLHQVSTGSCPGFSRKVRMYAQTVMVIQMNTS